MKIVLTIISLLPLLVACSRATVPVYDRLPNDETGEGLVSIEWLKSCCRGRSTIVEHDVSIEGTVIANDLYGEFYKTVIIADDSGGIEISIDRRRLCDDFHLYSQVAVFCHGLALGRVDGKVVLGMPPADEYAVDRIAPEDVDRYISFFSHADMSDPKVVTIGGLSVEYVSAFVFIRNLRLVESERGLSWCDAAVGDEDSDDEAADSGRWLTYTDRHFTDERGDMLTVRTLNGCSYGGELIPEGSVSLAGIIEYFGGMYYLRIADHHILEEER